MSDFPLLPAELLLQILADTIPDTPDYSLWFNLAHSCRILRSGVHSYVRKALLDVEEFEFNGPHALHTRLEKHLYYQMLGTSQQYTRGGWTYLCGPVRLKSEAPTRKVGSSTGAQEQVQMARTEDGAVEDEAGAWGQLQRGYWEWKPVKLVRDGDREPEWLELETVTVPGYDQDLEIHAQQESSAAASTPLDQKENHLPSLYFTIPALARSTAETAKIDFEPVQIQVHSLRRSDRETPGGRAWTARVLWREIWAKKMARERYVNLVQARKQQEFVENLAVVAKANLGKEEGKGPLGSERETADDDQDQDESEPEGNVSGLNELSI